MEKCAQRIGSELAENSQQAGKLLP
jgi:hypothetical protein